MSDADRLLEAFASGELVRPTAERASLVNLSRALLAVGGGDSSLSAHAERIAALVGEPRHLLFVLADGVGMHFLKAMPESAFMRRQLAMPLITPFPSTTAVGLTSLATGEWPAQHAVTGWWTYLREIDGAATVVRFERRSDGRPLGQLGVAPERLLPLPSRLSRMPRAALALLPSNIVETAYSEYATGGARRLGYGTLQEAAQRYVEYLAAAEGPTYTYLYTPRVDGAAHDHGTAARVVADELAALDRWLEELASTLDGRARIVMSADHGHLDAPVAHRRSIGRRDAIARMLRVAPAYDARVMCFHLRPGADGEFRERFAARYGEIAFLLSVDEVAALELLGPGPLSPLTRERVGDYMAIVRGDDAFGYLGATGGREIVALASHHSGLTPEQMLVPLVIA